MWIPPLRQVLDAMDGPGGTEDALDLVLLQRYTQHSVVASDKGEQLRQHDQACDHTSMQVRMPLLPEEFLAHAAVRPSRGPTL
mmetsp:Transcript_44607/g.103944  ORF Transcript_44607/g.103944 Transcript_44607/m.103944 type:complete len:83 (-) Transcript_44607:1364-1612(-)